MAQPIEDIVFSILSRDARVVASITDSNGTVRIYPGELPQSASLPAVRVAPINANPVEDMDGGNELENTSVQVDAYALTSSAAAGLSEAIRISMNEHRSTEILGTQVYSITRTTTVAFTERPDEGSDRKIHRRMAEFSIWHDQNL